VLAACPSRDDGCDDFFEHLVELRDGPVPFDLGNGAGAGVP